MNEIVGDIVTLPEWLGSAQVKLIDEYRPGIWQVESVANGVQFLLSKHVIHLSSVPEHKSHYVAAEHGRLCQCMKCVPELYRQAGDDE